MRCFFRKKARKKRHRSYRTGKRLRKKFSIRLITCYTVAEGNEMLSPAAIFRN